MRRLERNALKEEEKLIGAEQTLESDHAKFEAFLKENDRTSVEAIKQAEAQTKIKIDKQAEIKKLQVLYIVVLNSSVNFFLFFFEYLLTVKGGYWGLQKYNFKI